MDLILMARRPKTNILENDQAMHGIIRKSWLGNFINPVKEILTND